MADIKVAGPLEVPVAHAADTGAPPLVLLENTAGLRSFDDEHIVDAASEIEDDGLPKVHHLLESIPWKERSCSPLSASPAYSGPTIGGSTSQLVKQQWAWPVFGLV